MRAKMLTLIAALLCSTTMFAYDLWVYPLAFNLNAETQTAEVTYVNNEVGYGYNYGRNITSADIPETVQKDGVTYTVTSIGDHAFENCKKLNSVTVPGTVTSIGRYAFAFCETLPTISVPNSVKSIGDNAFYECSGVDTESQPGTIINTGLTTVNIGSGVATIGSRVFKGCSVLTAINVANNNLNFCSVNGVLLSKYKKTLITYPCGKEGFYIIPLSVTTIKANAFDGCANLTGVSIPVNVTDIEDYAFNNCNNLPIEDGLRYADTYLVETRSNKTSYSIREGTRWIGPDVFRNNTTITDVVIPNSVTTISAGAFHGCTGLSLLVIPDKVASIGRNAFYNVPQIKYFGTATGGPWGAKSWIGGNKKEVYTVFDRSVQPTTLTYYYDNRRASHTNVTEVYDPDALRFEGIAGAVEKAVIDPSMKDAPLTSLDKLFYGGYSTGTGQHITLSSMTAVEGLENLNTANVTDMSYMFYGCSALQKVDISIFNTGKLTTTTSMFDGCTGLTTIYCNDDWSTKLTSSENMFAQCTSLRGGTWPMTQFDATKTDGAYARPSETTDYGEVTTPGYFTHTTNELYTVFDESTGILTYYFDDRRQSRSGIVKSIISGGDFEGYNERVLKAVIDPSMKNYTPGNLNQMFYDSNYPLSNMTAIEGLENLNTANVEGMWAMFQGCSALTALDLSSFNTANVKDVTAMFYGCSSLTTIYCDEDWSGKTGNWMFSYCDKLMGGQGTQLDPDHTDQSYARPDEGEGKPGYFTTKGANVYTEFDPATGTLTYRYGDQYHVGPYVEVYNPAALRFTGYNNKIKKAIIDPSMKNANLTSLESMFFGGVGEGSINSLINLKSIEGLENLNTANVTNMANMFFACNSLESLDLTTFDVSKVTNMDLMFNSCYALMTIFCSEDWSVSPALTSDSYMFNASGLLVGGHGTGYDPDKVDKSYARPDGGESKPGYFTMRGDANGDDQVTLTDAVSIVNAIMGKPSPDFNKGAANLNGDVDEQGEPKVTVSDAVGVMNMLQGQ